jgi:hypothetical protein
MSRKKKKWSFQAGERPHTVTVEEREPGGVIYGRVWDPSARNGDGNWIRRSLKHSDRERAKAWALDQAAKLAKGDESIRAGKVTLAQVLAAYETSPHAAQDGARAPVGCTAFGDVDPSPWRGPRPTHGYTRCVGALH